MNQCQPRIVISLRMSHGRQADRSALEPVQERSGIILTCLFAPNRDSVPLNKPSFRFISTPPLGPYRRIG